MKFAFRRDTQLPGKAARAVHRAAEQRGTDRSDLGEGNYLAELSARSRFAWTVGGGGGAVVIKLILYRQTVPGLGVIAKFRKGL